MVFVFVCVRDYRGYWPYAVPIVWGAAVLGFGRSIHLYPFV
jgi:hypothetical protein